MIRSEMNAERKASEERIAKARAETQAAVTTGRCPRCGSKLRRNRSLRGWWMCEQRGAPDFRARPGDPRCDWDGFTE